MNKNQPESRRTAPWTRPRHRVAWAIFRPFIGLYARLKYGVRARRFREPGPHLILFNHQTPFDQFFVMMSVPGAVYYLATEDIFSIGWPAKLMSWLAAPIPIRKQSTDTRAIRTMIRVAREGGTVCLAPEGNRTYSGKTEYMQNSMAGRGMLAYIVAAVGVNGLVEMLVSTVLTGAVGSALEKAGFFRRK